MQDRPTNPGTPVPPAGTQADPCGLARVAYEAHFALCQHYSSIVFKGRVGIVTLTVAAV